jgi:uncharacterized protein
MISAFTLHSAGVRLHVPLGTSPSIACRRSFRVLSFVGTVAMLWVGGSIIIHGVHSYGIDLPQQVVHVISGSARAAVPSIGGLLAWLAIVITSAVFGLVVGAITALAVVPVLTPLWRAVRQV